MPTVAAALVTYNRKDLLVEAIDAVFAQTHPVERLFVVDNASTDGTGGLPVLRDARVTYVRLPDNRGGAAASHGRSRSRATPAATGSGCSTTTPSRCPTRSSGCSRRRPRPDPRRSRSARRSSTPPARSTPTSAAHFRAA
jgi:hypothetical protein